MNKLPRGIRCNNPLNIKEWEKDKTTWIGERATDDDPIFEEFETMGYGIRAAMMILRKYFQKYGLNTVDGIIRRWSETDQESYIETVCKELAVEPYTKLAYDKKTICRLVDAMSFVENGGHYLTVEQLWTGWKILNEI